MAKFSKKQRLYVYQFCADMINAQLPLYDSLQKLQIEGQALLGKGFSKKILGLLELMAKETSVAAVFSGTVPSSELSVITAAERSGSLAEGFITLVNIINFNDALRKRIIGAMVFPTIMLVLSLVVIAGYAVGVFPKFASVVPVEKWPAVTQNLYSFGTALYGGLWMVLLAIVIGMGVAVSFAMTSVTGPVRNRALDKIIPFSTYRQICASVFLNNLSLMLRNEIPLADALSIVSLNANRWLKGHINVMLEKMSQGVNYGKALDSGLLGTEELLNISLYADLPSFNDVLLSVSEKSRENIKIYIQKLAGILKNLSTVVLGGTVIWVFAGLFMLMDTLSKLATSGGM